MTPVKQLKLAQDRAALLLSYDKMVKVFKVPRTNRVTRAEFAAMNNGQIMQVCKDVYNNAPLKAVKKFQAMMEPKKSVLKRIKGHITLVHARWWFKWFHFKRFVKRLAHV